MLYAPFLFDLRFDASAIGRPPFTMSQALFLPLADYVY
jgi:hypothetical protein